MMRYFSEGTLMLAYLLVVYHPLRCNAFSTSQQRVFDLKRHATGKDKSLWPNNRMFTFLAAGRDRRISISDVQLKLLTDEDKSRQKRLGRMKQRLQKESSRENRISALELKLKNAERMPIAESEVYMTKAERAELQGLVKVRESFEEQYDPKTFTKEHLEFKAMHNDAFIQLSKYCQDARDLSEEANVFFLDGPDGATASALIHKGGFDPAQCYVANRHESSCVSLRMSGGGLLPDENVVHATAAEALTASEPIFVDGVDGSSPGEYDADITSLAGKDGAFARVNFIAYYFDGCGGFVPHIVGMLSAALLRLSSDREHGPIAVGYSLLGGNKDVVGKELAISRALTILARMRGMKMVHPLDDPTHYEISPDIQKIGGSNDGTFTTWLLLQPES